jgi:hypothetical protein
MVSRPSPASTPEYYRYYLGLVSEQDLISALKNSLHNTLSLFGSVPDGKENYSYAPGKWTVKEVFSHIIDTERIFGYRALRFSRKDDTQLPGYEENSYAPNSNCINRSLEKMLEEYNYLRLSGISLFESMTDEMLDYSGIANDLRLNARQIGFMMCGHNLHHNKVVEERYLHKIPQAQL